LKKTLLIAVLQVAAWPCLAAAGDLSSIAQGPDPLAISALSSGPNLAAANAPNQSSERNIGDEEMQPKEPYLATMYSVLPGVLIHGTGNFYAGDYQFGTKMLVMEILGGAMSLWGYNLIHQPGNWGPYFGNEEPQAGYWIKAAGVGLLAVSWVGDVATAADAADTWNKDHQLEFQMDSMNGTGARLSLSAKF